MIKVKEYLDVKKRAEELGCNIPNSLAILPRDFANAKSKGDLLHEDTTSTVRVLWKQEGVIETPIEKAGESIPAILEESFYWVGPTIFFASTLIIQNPHLIDIALGVISNYLTDWFKGLTEGRKKATLDVVVETKSGSYKEIHYEGAIEGLEELPKVIRSLHDEQ